MHSGIIKKAFHNAHELTKDLESNRTNNSLRSSLFVKIIGDHIIHLPDYQDKKLSISCITFDEEEIKKGTAIKKIPGEWMLDLIICEKVKLKREKAKKPHVLRVNIECAVESEFDTSVKEFFEDFSKLLAIKANTKLYLNGYSTTNFNPKKFKAYYTDRLNTAAELIERFDSKGNYFLGFWPSPKEIKKETFWKTDDVEDNICKLFKWNGILWEFLP